jgi:hypothetical protein
MIFLTRKIFTLRIDYIFQKNIFKILLQKFGNNKKLVQSLHPQNKKHVTQATKY